MATITHDLTYSFTIEDLTKPELLSAKTRGLTQVRVKFNEDVIQGTGLPGDALAIKNIGAGISILPASGPNPARLIASRDVFLATDVGLYLGVAGADNALNNDIFEIASFISPREVEITPTDVIEEALPEGAIVTVCPYRVDGVPDASRVNPYFNPVVVGIESVAADEVELTLHTEITQKRLYGLFCVGVEDLKGNAMVKQSVEFTTEACNVPQERIDAEFDYVSFMPEENLEQDKTRDLERFLRVLDEPMQLLFCDIDNFPTILDVDLIAEENLDALLDHLGAPFSFTRNLPAQDKRRLAGILVQAYKRKGVEVAIEAFVNFVLGVEIDVRPYLAFGDEWVLGESELGVDTILGVGTLFLRYSFEVEAFSDLTEVKRRQLIEIVQYMKTSHTHFVRLIEPTNPDTPVNQPPTS